MDVRLRHGLRSRLVSKRDQREGEGWAIAMPLTARTPCVA
jgi:hypothetical protein